MSLSDVRTRVYNNLNRSDIPNTNGGLIDQWINDAQRQICRAHNFHFMEAEVTTSTVDQQQKYSIPTGTGTTLRFKCEISCELVNSDSYRVPLKHTYKQTIEDKAEYQDTNEKGEPKHYCIQDEYIWLYPKPYHADNENQPWTINLEYYGYLDDLSADADTNYLITNHPDAVEAGATWLGFKYAYEEERAEYWKGFFRELITDLINEDNQHKYENLEDGIKPIPGCGATNQPGYLDLLSSYD